MTHPEDKSSTELWSNQTLLVELGSDEDTTERTTFLRPNIAEVLSELCHLPGESRHLLRSFCIEVYNWLR